MNNQTFFLIVIVLILIFYLPAKKTTNQNQPNQQNQQTCKNQESSRIFDSISQSILPTTKTQQNNQTQQTKTTETQNIINEYLNENECKENFNTMGPNMDTGNNMDFKQQVNATQSTLSKALSKSLVPDFQPNYLNINPELNSYGYSATNPEADRYYEARGFMNPTDGYKFADSVSHMLSHPYQTRYCEKQN